VADKVVGDLGVVAGVPVTVADAALAPAIVTVFNFTEYVVPFVSPIMEIGDIESAGLRDANEVPPFVEY